jgi:EAL domain-containing protein (putative c-di-GMP-specific phosphodiesterase class I)
MTHMDELSQWLTTTCARIATNAIDDVIVASGLHASLNGDALRHLAVRSVRHQIGDAVVRRAPTIVYQPIVHLESGAVIAHEAVVRSFADEAWVDAPAMSLQSELELGALRGLTAEVQHADDAFVCVMVDLELVRDPRLAELVVDFPCDRLVLEIAADADLAVFRSLHDEIDALRRHGVRFALNDLGSGNACLERVTAIQPEMIKIDVSDAQRFGRDERRRALVSEIVEVARRAGAFVIATGIESSEQISVARELGVEAGEGLLLLMSASVPA